MLVVEDLATTWAGRFSFLYFFKPTSCNIVGPTMLHDVGFV